MNNILLILGSGKSTRFGGVPKVFADLGRCLNVENTIEKALGKFDDIYLIVDESIYDKIPRTIFNCKIFSICSGHGEGHSLLRAMNRLAYDYKVADDANVTLCWGDTYFKSADIFEAVNENEVTDDVAVLAFCAYDEMPYAWFEISEEAYITNSLFKNEKNSVDKGLHDQSIFKYRMGVLKKQLLEYKKYIRIQEEYNSGKPEMRLLNAFSYFYCTDNLLPARAVVVESGNTVSFNTQIEFETVIKMDKEINYV